MTHTPTPWGSYATNDGSQYRNHITSPGKTIAHIYCSAPHEDDANAEFIVKACNVHDDLVSALSECIDALTNATDEDADFVDGAIRRASAALAKAGAL